MIMDNCFDEIFVIDPQGTILYVNNACKRLYGAKPEEIIGKSIYEMEKIGYYSPVVAPVCLEKKETVTVEQITTFGKKLLVTMIPVFDDAGEIRLVVMNSRDVTELEQLKYDVEETNKLLGHYEEEIRTLRSNELSLAGVVTQSPKLMDCYTMAKKVSRANAAVLILGESGVGKMFWQNLSITSAIVETALLSR